MVRFITTFPCMHESSKSMIHKKIPNDSQKKNPLDNSSTFVGFISECTYSYFDDDKAATKTQSKM